jgi:hypothetical protein
MSLKYIVSSILEPVSYLLFFIAILIYLKYKISSRKHKVLVIYFLIGFLLLLGILWVDPNNYLYRYLYLLTGIFFSIYFFLLFESFYNRWLTLLLGVLTILYFLYEQYSFDGVQLFPSMGYVIVSTIIIFMIFIYFYQLMTHVNGESLSLNFDFWFICCQLAYHLGAFGIFLTYNKLTEKILPTEHFSNANRSLMTYLWGAHNVLLFIASLGTWVGVLWILYQTKSKNRIQTDAGKNLF